jgi:Cytochrome P460
MKKFPESGASGGLQVYTNPIREGQKWKSRIREAGTPILIEEVPAMKTKSILTVALITVLLAVLGSVAISAQDKYTLQVPNGLAFSDFRGYENWQVVAVSQTEELLKVMVANPTMIDAYRAGVPGNGKPFPDGSKIAKIEWKPKKNTESPFSVRVPDTLQDIFFIEKNLKKFPSTKGWAYAVFDYNAASDKFTPNATGVVNCGYACHTRVAAKDYIFTAYGKR